MAEGKYFLTGLPGSGKSTVFIRCVERLKEMGYAVGGIATPEVRSRGRRTGFSVIDIATGRRGQLAGVDVSSSFRVGRYGVNIPEFESVALPALDHAEESCDVIGIDEIGRMEFFSKPFERRVDDLIHGSKTMVSVLHRNYADRYRDMGTTYVVSPESRDGLTGIVVSCLLDYLRNSD